METALGPPTHLYQISLVVNPTGGGQKLESVSQRRVNDWDRRLLTAFNFDWTELAVEREVSQVHGTRGRDRYPNLHTKEWFKKIKNQKRFFPFFVWFGRDCTGVIYWRTWKPLLIRWSLVCWSYVWVLNVWLTRTRHIQPRVDSGANICILDYLHSGQNRAGWDVASSISWRFLASCRLWVARHTAAPFWISSGESFWESIKPAGWIKHCTSATEMLLKRWHILRSVKGSVLISILISDTR